MRNTKLTISLLCLITLVIAIALYSTSENNNMILEERHIASSGKANFHTQEVLSNSLPLSVTSTWENSSTSLPHTNTQEQRANILSESLEITGSKSMSLEINETNEFENIDDSPEERFYQAALDWSADIGFMMVKAEKDIQTAEETFNFLQNCTENTSTALAYRAICAANLQRLSKKQSRLFGQRYAALKATFPADIEKFLEEAPTNF